MGTELGYSILIGSSFADEFRIGSAVGIESCAVALELGVVDPNSLAVPGLLRAIVFGFGRRWLARGIGFRRPVFALQAKLLWRLMDA
jgi:hypothetical protein